jgi:hypothetical protein
MINSWFVCVITGVEIGIVARLSGVTDLFLQKYHSNKIIPANPKMPNVSPRPIPTPRAVLGVYATHWPMT